MSRALLSTSRRSTLRPSRCPAVHVPKPHIPPLFWQGVLDVYCDLVQALVPVQLLWVVSPGFEQVPALVQLLWVE